MSELRFEDVTVRYGSGRSKFTAVEGASLVIPAGTTVGLVGESGSGKSTLAKTSVSLAPVDSGRVVLGDRDVRQRRRKGGSPIRMVFQDPYSSLDPRMTVGESIRESMPAGASKGKAARAEVERLLDLVNLDGASMDRLPGQLSGGQRQRVGLARALAGRPQVVIADEITSALDVSVQATVLNLVRDLQRELGFSMLFISHNISVVRYVCQSVAVMYRGVIVETGPAQGVLSRPQHSYTRQLLAAVPGHTGSTMHSSRIGSPESGARGRLAKRSDEDPRAPRPPRHTPDEGDA